MKAGSAASSPGDRLLAVTAVPPWPARDGYSLRAGRLIRELSRRWPVTVVSPEGGPVSSGDSIPERVRWQQVDGVPATNMLPWREGRRRLATAVRSLLSEAAFRGAILWNGTEYLAAEIAGFPAAVSERIDCEALQAWRKLRHRGSLRRRLQELRRGLELAIYERRFLRPLAGIVATGPDDAAALERITGHSGVAVVPNGVDLPALDDLPEEDEQPTVIFTGVLSYGPNAEAARWFAEEVWPAIREREPGARFVIAGRSPGPDVKALGDNAGISVRADVPDLSEEIRRAWLAVAPMRSGSGIKNKVLEAWAVGRPVVLTELATNGLGIGADHPLNGLVCRTGAEIARTVMALLEDGEHRNRLCREARSVAERHDWESRGEQLAEFLTDAHAGIVDPRAAGRE